MGTKKKFSILLSIFVLTTVVYLAHLYVNKHEWQVLQDFQQQLTENNEVKAPSEELQLLYRTETDTFNLGAYKETELTSYKVHIFDTSFIINRKENIVTPRVEFNQLTQFHLNDTFFVSSPNLQIEPLEHKTYLLDNEITGYHYYIPEKYFKEGENHVKCTVWVKQSMNENFTNYKIESLNSGISKLINIERKIISYASRLIDYFFNNVTADLPHITIDKNIRKFKINEKKKCRLNVTHDDKEQILLAKLKERGFSSRRHPYRSYSVDIYDSTKNRLNTNLLNLPEDSEWVFYSAYLDKSLIRNALAYSLFAKTGMYCSRFKYFHMFTACQYNGLYVLLEKQKLGEHRIVNVSGNDILFELGRLDEKKKNWLIYTADSSKWYNFNVRCPKEDMLNEEDYLMLKEKLTMLNREFEQQPLNHVKIDSLLDIRSFLLSFLFNEFAKNPDNFRFSTNFSYNPTSDSASFVLPSIWDFDLGFGNCLEREKLEYRLNCHRGWTFSSIDNDVHSRLPWIQYMLEDEYYSEKIKSLWVELRQNYFHKDTIFNTIDNLYNIVSSSANIHYSSTRLYERGITPTPFSGYSLENEHKYLKNWIDKRLYWLDKNFAQEGPVTVVSKNEARECNESSKVTHSIQ